MSCNIPVGRCCRVFDKDQGGWLLIPGCFGAMHGHADQCTCTVKPSKVERHYRRELAQAKNLIRALRKANRWNLNLMIKKGGQRPTCDCEYGEDA